MGFIGSIPNLTDVNKMNTSLTISNLVDDVMETLSTPINGSPMGGMEYPSQMFGVSIDSLMKGDATLYFTLKKKIKRMSAIYEELKKEAEDAANKPKKR